MVRLCFVEVDAVLDLDFQSSILIFDFDFRFSIFKYFFVLTLSRVSATVGVGRQRRLVGHAISADSVSPVHIGSRSPRAHDFRGLAMRLGDTECSGCFAINIGVD